MTISYEAIRPITWVLTRPAKAALVPPTATVAQVMRMMHSDRTFDHCFKQGCGSFSNGTASSCFQ
ncbi:MAG: hypothetical protein IPO07_25995 [Haliscomenobacter sp.]|nr:hypothetical protein [Haliscomenobacter sp.]MBK9491865.1 hypothetical protein [Haliscomenobacter sp.]